MDHHNRLFALLLAALLCCLPRPVHALESAKYLVYVGTIGDAHTIYSYRFDGASGKLDPLGPAVQAARAAYLAPSSDQRFLYATGETSTSAYQTTGLVCAYRIDARTGKLTPLNQVSARGVLPSYVAVDKTGRNLLCANYTSGSVAVFPIQPDGSLAPASDFIQLSGSSVALPRQSGPHTHSINLSPDNRFALAADLGLDKVFVYRFDPARGKLTPNDTPFATVPPGSGARHLRFSPDGRFVYVINEMGSSVTAFAWDPARGALTPLQTVSTLPAGFKGSNGCSEMLIHPGGRFLYGANRGHDSIAVFAIDPASGRLTLLENVPTQGSTPRGFGIDPSGSWLIAANQAANTLVIFRIDPATGRLTPTGDKIEGVIAPATVKFIPLP